MNTLKWIFIVLVAGFLLGWVLPALFSAKSTEAVLIGIFVLVFILWLVIENCKRKLIGIVKKKDNNSKEK